MIWNTVYHVTYEGRESLKDSVLPVLNRVSHSLSVFDSNSLITQLNDSNCVEADHHLVTVYEASIRINRLSHGKFDPTVSPLIDAWGFGIGHKASADTLTVDSILDFVGIQKTFRDGNKIIKQDPRTRFNFSAIAKGYGCDAVGHMFKRNGVHNFMVEIGGELTLSGQSPSGNPWKIAVDAPIDDINPGEESVIILSLSNAGVATSGNYRNFRLENGRKVVHTISPITGYPVLGSILSATVIAPDCMVADGIATACMASSPEEAKNLIREENVEGLLVFNDSIWYSPGFSRYVISEVSEPGKTIRN